MCELMTQLTQRKREHLKSNERGAFNLYAHKQTLYNLYFRINHLHVKRTTDADQPYGGAITSIEKLDRSVGFGCAP